MIIVGPSLKDGALHAVEGPFFNITVEPVVEKGSPSGRQKHSVKVHIRFEQLKFSQLANRLSAGMRVGRRANYATALKAMEKLQVKHRQFKRQDRLAAATPSQKLLKIEAVTITGDVADTLVLASPKAREIIASVAALEAVGLPQAQNNEYTDAVYNTGFKLAEHLRKQCTGAIWIDGAKNVEKQFDDVMATFSAQRPKNPQKVRRNTGPRR